MRTRFAPALAVTGLMLALAAGCGSDDPDVAEPAATNAASVSRSATSSLAGTYTRRMTRGDIERTDRLRQEGPGQEKPEPGPLELTLNDGTLKMTDVNAQFSILQDFSATSDGAFRLGAYQHPEEGSFCGPDIPQTATYSWKMNGDVLTLKAQDDECADRDSVLSGRWKRR